MPIIIFRFSQQAHKINIDILFFQVKKLRLINIKYITHRNLGSSRVKIQI